MSKGPGCFTAVISFDAAGKIVGCALLARSEAEEKEAREAISRLFRPGVLAAAWRFLRGGGR